MKAVEFKREFKLTNKGIQCNRITPKEGYRFINKYDKNGEPNIVYDFISCSSSEDWSPMKVFPGWDQETRRKHPRALEILAKYGITNPFGKERKLLPSWRYIVLFYAGKEIVFSGESEVSISHEEEFLYSEEWQEFLERV